MRPNQALRLLLMLSAIVTFAAGMFAAHGQDDLFLLLLLVLVLVWCLVLTLKPGEKAE